MTNLLVRVCLAAVIAFSASSVLAQGAMTAARLTGNWVPKGGFCASGEPIQLKSGGVYRSEGVRGTWALAAGRVTLRYREMNPSTGAYGREQRAVGIVAGVNANEITIAWDGRRATRYRRCPANGAYEPWSR